MTARGAGAGAGDAVRIVGIGAGPAGLMVLERVLANHARDYPELRLDIRLVDPHEPGGGRIWRRTQSPLLKLNTMLRDDAVFTDASCEIDGPIAPGPSLAEWIAEVRAGRIDRPAWWDDLLERELREVTDESFPTRRLNSAYLSWAYREIIARAAPTATVQWVRDRVIAVEEPESRPGAAAGPHLVRLESGASLEADLVLHAIGHNGSEPSQQSQKLADFARRRGLSYVPPAFTADVDLDWIVPSTDVIVRGMGLAAIDLVVLLTEGRGGAFVRTGERLRYLPSGREPVLHLGSRRGVPYRSEVTTQQLGDPTQLEYVGDAFHERVAAARAPLDFGADVWPLVAAELLTGYYRELFTGHPEQVQGGWDDFAPRLRTVLSQSGGHASRELAELIASRVPNPVDRFDLASFDRPLQFSPSESGASTAHLIDDDALLQRRVREHIEVDLRLRTTPRHSATQGLFMAALHTYMSLAEVPRERWNARSITQDLPRRWMLYFSYLASGPPGHRLEELVALSEAGLVRFLGGDVELELDERHGVFRASGRAEVGGRAARSTASAETLIDAWLPEATAASSDNPLLRQLVSSGQAHEISVIDDSGDAGEVFAGSTGQLAVAADGRLAGSTRQFALGAFTSTPTGGAFARPGLNSLPFRVSDRVARGLLEAASQLAEESESWASVTASITVSCAMLQ